MDSNLASCEACGNQRLLRVGAYGEPPRYICGQCGKPVVPRAGTLVEQSKFGRAEEKLPPTALERWMNLTGKGEDLLEMYRELVADPPPED